MKEVSFTATPEHTGSRLDRYLVGRFENKYSRTFIKKLIDDDHVRVNGVIVNAHYKVTQGEVTKVTIPDPKPIKLEPEEILLQIVYEDNDLIVINKPSGISVHPAGPHLTGTLVNALLHHCKDLSGIGGKIRPGIVHRLDKDTSGLLVVAKNDKTHLNLSGQFKNRTIKKKYIALVKGIVQLDNGRIELPIARRKKDITKMGISFVDEKKKKAITNYKVLKRFKDFTLLELLLETGRTHQIRVHLSHIGHAVIGDKLYGSQKGMRRQALHAKSLGFYHPATKKFMEFDSDIPSDIKELIERGHI